MCMWNAKHCVDQCCKQRGVAAHHRTINVRSSSSTTHQDFCGETGGIQGNHKYIIQTSLVVQ